MPTAICSTRSSRIGRRHSGELRDSNLRCQREDRSSRSMDAGAGRRFDRAAIRRAKHVALFLRSSRKSKHVLLDGDSERVVGNPCVGITSRLLVICPESMPSAERTSTSRLTLPKEPSHADCPRDRKNTDAGRIRENTYNVSFCFELEPTPNSISHSLTLAPITSGWSSCR